MKKRSVGRPKKVTKPEESGEPQTTPKKRGRPLGSVNKKKCFGGYQRSTVLEN
jgi:hypothetical protein